MGSGTLLVHAMFDGLRYLAQTMFLGFAVIGATFCGGSIIYAAWHRQARDRSRQPEVDDPVAHEAATGIAEIEAFLALQDEPRLQGPEPRQPDAGRNDDAG